MRRFPIIFLSLLAIACVVLSACGSTASGKTSVVSADPQVAEGAKLVQSNSCLGCHTLTGKRASGPSFKDLAGSQITLSDGRTVTADDAYLAQSITDPDSEIVKGYPKSVMSQVVGGHKKLTQEQVNAIVAYLKTIKTVK